MKLLNCLSTVHKGPNIDIQSHFETQVSPITPCSSRKRLRFTRISAKKHKPYSPTARKLARDLKREKGIRSAANFMATFDPRPSRK